MKGAMIFTFFLLLGLIGIVIDFQRTSQKGQALDDFAKLSKLYTLQIEKNDFVYRKKE